MVFIKKGCCKKSIFFRKLIFLTACNCLFPCRNTCTNRYNKRLKKNAKGIRSDKKSGKRNKRIVKIISGFRLPSKACSKYPTRREEKISPSKINKIALNPLKIWKFRWIARIFFLYMPLAILMHYNNYLISNFY